MKLDEIQGAQDYKLYLDVDGVFADFDKKVVEVTGKHPQDQNENEMWAAMKKYAKEHPEVQMWGDLDLLSDAMKLWSYVKDYNPTFLTSTGTWAAEKASKEKHAWIKKHFPGHDVITVPRSKMKSNYAAKNHILVDDRMKSIGPWREAGGIGILHKSASDTIAQLKKLGL